MVQEIESAQPTELPATDIEETDLFPDPRLLPMNSSSGLACAPMDSLSLYCTWSGCSHDSFARRSDPKKHWEKHTKPYICEELGCNALAFGDKAGLRRHEEERHGKHDARRYYCPIQSCPRAKKGFPKKRNRDLHISTQHRAESMIGSDVSGEGTSSTTPPGVGNEILGKEETKSDENLSSMGGIVGLKSKLIELERESEQLRQEMEGLSSRQLRKDEDIQALKRAMQIFVE